VGCCMGPPRPDVDAMDGVKLKVTSRYVSADLPRASRTVYFGGVRFAGLN
jgi:hypothetical protein